MGTAPTAIGPVARTYSYSPELWSRSVPVAGSPAAPSPYELLLVLLIVASWTWTTRSMSPEAIAAPPPARAAPTGTLAEPAGTSADPG